jgi:uncharacterized membrane protein
VSLKAIRQDARKRSRIQALREQYPEYVVQRILSGQIWQGQSEDQLVNTLGRPVDIYRKVLKAMLRKIWKCKQTSAKRFGLRITVENGYVVGWDHRG